MTISVTLNQDSFLSVFWSHHSECVLSVLDHCEHLPPQIGHLITGVALSVNKIRTHTFPRSDSDSDYFEPELVAMLD